MMSKTILLASAAGILGTAALIGATATAQSSSEAYSAEAISIEAFIGRVEVRTGSSDRIQVSMSNPGDHAEDPSIAQRGDSVMIDGGQSMRRLNCRHRNGRLEIGRGGWGMGNRVSIDEYPTLTITAPADVALELRDSAFLGEVGNVGTLNVSMNSCGRLDAGDVAGNANIRISGSGDVYVDEIGGEAMVDINGSGDVELASIGSDAEIDISGSGDVTATDVAGDVDISINGSGDVELGEIAGLNVRISGSGDILVEEMNGAFDTRVNGSGDIEVRGGRAEPFNATISGSGDIRFDGTAVNVTVRESGSGDVHVEDVEGSVDWRRNGRSVLRIGNAN